MTPWYIWLAWYAGIAIIVGFILGQMFKCRDRGVLDEEKLAADLEEHLKQDRLREAMKAADKPERGVPFDVVVRVVKLGIRNHGSLSAYSRHIGISPRTVKRLLSTNRASDRTLRAIGIRRIGENRYLSC